jgi:alkylation response protein AidB-like acyl-CoA dehydrogenase
VVLSGVKTFVNDAGCADFLLVSGNLDGAPCLAFVGAEQLNESSRQRETVIDETRRSYSVCLDGISVPADALIRGAAAASAFEQIRNTALLLISAESAGGIAGVLDVVVEYLNTRSAFGRRIGSYQALKHPTVDILVGLERVRTHVYHAASLLEVGENAEIALRMAKAEAADVFAFASDRAIQFHGGFGFTWECDAQLYLRRALWSQYAFGDAAHHRKRLAGLLLS